MNAKVVLVTSMETVRIAMARLHALAMKALKATAQVVQVSHH